MEKNLYIDASHPNETRVVLKSENNIEDYEYESINSILIKNNIYLGKVSRVEPSLQAAFIDFGRERHGFLSFNDIQSDYYQIPQSDIQKIKIEEEKAREELIKESEKEEEKNIIENKVDVDDPVEKNLDQNVNQEKKIFEKKYPTKRYKIHYHFSKMFSISSPIKERPKTKKNIANPGNKAVHQIPVGSAASARL